MGVQVVRESETFTALCTPVGLFFCVDFMVDSNFSAGCKGFLTNVTLVRSLSSVGSHVNIQAIGSREVLLADITLELLLIVVGLHVPVEVALDCKALGAVYTLKRPLSRVSSPVSF